MGGMVKYARTMLGGAVRFSPLMETEAVGVSAGGPRFLNRLAAGTFDGTGHELLQRCLQAECELGRERSRPGAPRTADIDIVLFGDVRIDEPDLRVPHPRTRDRRFCLEGLVRLVPDATPPGWGVSVREAYERMPVAVAAQHVAFVEDKG